MVAKVKMKNGSVVEMNSCQQDGSARNVRSTYCSVEERRILLSQSILVTPCTGLGGRSTLE